MRQQKNKLRTVFLVMVSAVVMFFSLTAGAMACGYGNSGGSDYVPQRQGPLVSNTPAPAAAIGEQEAKNIVNSHISKLNPDLTVGNINDNGGFFEVEVIDKSNEVIQLLGVDKYSGRLILIN